MKELLMSIIKNYKNYIDIRKKQYIDNAQQIKLVRNDLGLPDNKAGFEIAKTIIIEQNNLGARNQFKSFIEIILYLILCIIAAIITFFISQIKLKPQMINCHTIILLCILISLPEIIRGVVNLIMIKIDDIQIRILKSMSYDQYLCVLEFFDKSKKE